MQRSRRQDVKFRPAPLKPSKRVQEADSYCVACGSRNVIEFCQMNGIRSGDSQRRVEKMIKCQCCGVISPDLNQPKPRSGVREDFSPLDNTSVHQMADQVLDAFAHQHTKQKLQRALAFAQGDLALICRKYLPIAIEVFADVVCQFGFAEAIEGVTESVRLMQTHAKNDEALVKKLISIRKLLTPTAAWIQEDNDADKEDQRKKDLEQQALQQKEEDERRKELLELENIKKARLRTKKISMGLDPSVARPPLLLDVPASFVAARENARLVLRVTAKYVQTFQWFFNGHPIESESFVSGINRGVLVIAKLTKRVAGDYYCVCENDEGTTSTSTCRITIAKLTLSRLGSRALGTLPSSPLYTCEEKMALTCVGSKIVLYDAKSLIMAKSFPSLPALMETLAWEPRGKMIAVFSAAAQQGRQKEAIRVFFYSPENPSTVPSSSISPAPSGKTNRRTNSGLGSSLSTKAKAMPLSNALRFQLIDVQPIDTMADVHAADFLDDGRKLIVTDMKHHIALYDTTPTFACSKSIVFDNNTVCYLAVHPTAPTKFAVAFRNKSFIKVFQSEVSDSATPRDLQEHHIDFKFPVHRVSFDVSGVFLAVAETGFMKAWISIVNVLTKKPSSNRFIAHVGNISGLQWTTKTSLLISCSQDGYVKVWDPVTTSSLLNVHIDAYGIHTMGFMEKSAIVVLVGYSDSRLQSRSLIQLAELEESRLVEMNEQVIAIQKIWKGKKTRELIAKYIKTPKN